MSVETSSTPGRPEEQVPSSLESGAEHAASADGIRHQAARIIEAVLADDAPGHARARELLRQQMAAHPGCPERALMEHLAALRGLGGPNKEPSDADGPVRPEFASGE